MARGINKVILIGNLGADPETRYSQSGAAITNLNVATDESYKDKNTGQVVPKTEWHRVAIYGKLAEIAGQYLRKGSKVYLEGKLATRKWQDQQGQDRYSTEVVLDVNGTLQMLDGKPEESQQTPQPQQRQQAPQQRQQPQQNQQAANQYRQASSGSSAPPAFDDYDIPGFD